MPAKRQVRAIVLSLLMVLSVAAMGTTGSALGASTASPTIEQLQATENITGTETPTDMTTSEPSGQTDEEQPWVLVHIKTGDTRVFDGDLPRSQLPVDLNNYHIAQVGVAGDGNDSTTTTQTRTIGTQTHSISPQTRTIGTQIGVSLEQRYDLIGSNDTVRLRVGAYNGTTKTPLANYRLTVNLTNQTGAVLASKSVVTNTSGGAVVSFDMGNYPDGEYNVEVTDGLNSNYINFVAGEFTTILPEFGGLPPTKGQQVTYGVRVTNGGVPVAGVTRNVTIEAPNGTIVARKTVTTDSNGVATFSFTPSTIGEYYNVEIDHALGNTRASFRVGAATAQVGLPRDSYASYQPGETVPINAFVRANGTPLANANLQVTILNDSRDPVDNFSVTTNAQGFFSLNWTVPSSTEERDYTLRIRTGSGQPVTSDFPFIDIEEPSDGPTDGPTEPSIDVEITTSGFEYLPGTALNVAVSVTNRSGAPVSGATVNLLNTIEFNGAPIGNATVTTDSTGSASATIVLPSTLSYGVEYGFIEATTVVNGTRTDGSAFYSLKHFEVERHFSGLADDFNVVPGTTVTLNYTVREATSGDTLGDPVSGIPIHATGKYGSYEAGIFGTAYATTDADGNALLQVAIPSDAVGSVNVEEFTRVDDIFGLYAEVDAYDTTLRGLNQFEYARNETLSFNYTVNTTSTVGAVVTVTTFSDINDSTLFTGYVRPGETVSFTIPQTVPENTFYEVNVRAMSNAGTSGAASQYFRVQGGPTDEPLSISQTHGIGTGSDNDYFTKQVAITANQPLSLDNGTNYQFILTNEDTGNSVTLILNGSVELPTDRNLGLLVYNGDGTPRFRPRLWPAGVTSPLPADIVNGSIPTASGLTNFSVAIVNASSGTVINRTETAGSVIGYQGVLTQNSTSGMIELSIPRDVAPRDATVVLTLEEGELDHVGNRTEYVMSYDRSTDAFTTVVNASELSGGPYSWEVEFIRSAHRILQPRSPGSSNPRITVETQQAGAASDRVDASNVETGQSAAVQTLNISVSEAILKSDLLNPTLANDTATATITVNYSNSYGIDPAGASVDIVSLIIEGTTVNQTDLASTISIDGANDTIVVEATVSNATDYTGGDGIQSLVGTVNGTVTYDTTGLKRGGTGTYTALGITESFGFSRTPPANVADRTDTRAPPAGVTPPALDAGNLTLNLGANASVANVTASNTSDTYSLTLNVTGNATNVTVYLRASVIEDRIGPLQDKRLLIDGTETEFYVVVEDGVKYVAFVVPSFSTKTITFEPAVTLGDVNDDGAINTGDVIQVQRSIVGLSTDPAFSAQAADVNSDGSVNTGDVIQIQRFIVGLSSVVPEP